MLRMSSYPFDGCGYRQTLRPGEYMLNPDPYYRKNCPTGSPYSICGQQNYGAYDIYGPRQVDQESELIGLNDILVKCDNGKCKTSTDDTCTKIEKDAFGACDTLYGKKLKANWYNQPAPSIPQGGPFDNQDEMLKALEAQETREKKATNTTTGMNYGELHFVYVPCNPQKLNTIVYPWTRGGDNSRLLINDVFHQHCNGLPGWTRTGEPPNIYTSRMCKMVPDS